MDRRSPIFQTLRTSILTKRYTDLFFLAESEVGVKGGAMSERGKLLLLSLIALTSLAAAGVTIWHYTAIDIPTIASVMPPVDAPPENTTPMAEPKPASPPAAIAQTAQTSSSPPAIVETAQAAPAAANKTPKVLYWHDPMVPGFKSDKPGRSPFMDMDLVPVYEDAAGGAENGGMPVVSIRPEIANNLGVRTHKVVKSGQPRRIVAQGYLLRDERRGTAAWRVLADIYDRDADWVRAGLKATMRIPTLPTRQWEGVVEQIDPDLSFGGRTLKAVVRIQNPDTALRLNLFAEVTIEAAPRSGKEIFIPRESVIRTGTRTAVVVARGEGRFQPVEVIPGIETGDWIEIREGLKEGDMVVTSGQFLLDSESNIRASFTRMETAPVPAKTKEEATTP